MGNTDDAQKILLQLQQEGNLDEDTLGILARTYKDQAFLRPAGGRHDLLETSAKMYREAYVQTDGFWTGINVATLERLLDNSSESEKVVHRIPCDRIHLRLRQAARLGETVRLIPDIRPAPQTDLTAIAGAMTLAAHLSMNHERR